MEKTNYENTSNNNIPKSGEEEIDLNDLWKGIVRKKRWLILVASLFFSGSVLYSLHARIFRPVYRGSFTLLIKDPMATDNIEKGIYDTSSTLFSGLANQSSQYEINTLITFLKSPIYLEPIAKDFNISLSALKNNLDLDQVSSEPGGISKGILNVYLKFKNRKIGEKILESLAESYLNYSLEQKQKKLKDGLNFLNQQRPEIQKKKDLLQSKLVNFREKYKLIQPSKEGSTLKERQEEIQNSIISITKERNRLIDVRNEIKNGALTARGLKQELAAGLSISDFDQGLLQELINVENQLAKAKSTYTQNSSVVRGLQKRLETIQPLLLRNQLEAVDTALKLNSGSLNSFKKLKKDIEEKFLEQPLLIKKYQNITQELEMANENLLSLVAARESFQLEMAQNSIPWIIISKPQMGSKPIKPNYRVNLLFGLIGGLFFGVIFAAIKDRQNHVFISTNEVKKDLNYTILGSLPHVEVFEELRKEKASILTLLNNKDSVNKKVDSYQRFFFQEAFRNLYTSIRFLDTTKSVKTLLVTSSLPKEGKTLTNILLAKTLADLGVKVLLIDSDLRKPQVHYRLGLNNLKGFSNLLIEPDMPIKEVLNKIENYDNWSVITGGTLPPDPTRLLGSQRFKNLVETLKTSGEYEIILFDSPPILGLADSLLISEVIDGIILLIGLGEVDRSLPKESIDKLKSMGINFYGIVTNETKTDLSSFNKGYGYGKYNKGYGGYNNYGYVNSYYPISTYQNYNQTEDENKDDSEDGREKNLSESGKTIGEDSNNLKKIFNKILKIKNKLTKWLDN